MSTSTGEAPYRRIAAELRRRIAAGELRPGDRVPSTRRITREFGVALATATKALAALRAEGVVTAVPRVGTVVAQSVPVAAAVPPPPARRRSAVDDLTREDVVRAAIAIADAEGLAAVSVRRVAAEIGIPTMSLYRYVPSKEDLHVGMLDALFAEASLPEPPPGWRAQVELVVRSHWEVLRRHRWAARLTSYTRPMPSARGMDYTERMLRPLVDAGLDAPTALHATIVLAGHATNMALQLDLEAELVQDTGQTLDAWYEAHDATLTQMIEAGPYPTLASLAEGPNLEQVFELGLTLILDGLAGVVSGDNVGGRAPCGRPGARNCPP
ncbi:TetR/AcrR family transcriptional regulator C-terminal domain-containing protein, partial [Actinomycetes bacterium KLBMP 9797]